MTTGISHSGTQNSANNVGGIRTYGGTVAVFTLPPNDYIAVFRSSSSSVGANATISNYIASNINTAVSGGLGAAANASAMFVPFLGSYSVTSAASPIR